MPALHPRSWLGAALAFSLGGVAAAQTPDDPAPGAPPPRAVALELEDCLGTTAIAVRRIVAAELGPSLLGGLGAEPAEEPEHVTRVHARCGVESAVLVVEHPSRAFRTEQRVDLSVAQENARGRLLALSIVELLSAAWAVVDAMPAPEPPPESQAPTPDEEPALVLPPVVHVTPAAPPAERPPPERALGVRAIGVFRVAGSPVHPSGGGGLGIDVALPYSLGVGAELRYEMGLASVSPLGDVAFHAFWGSVLALIRPLTGYNTLTLGLGVRVGGGWLEARPENGAGVTHGGVIFGPTFTTSTALHLEGVLYAYIGLELSWLTLTVSGVNGATGEEIARFGGPQIALTVGFELQPLDR